LPAVLFGASTRLPAHCALREFGARGRAGGARLHQRQPADAQCGMLAGPSEIHTNDQLFKPGLCAADRPPTKRCRPPVRLDSVRRRRDSVETSGKHGPCPTRKHAPSCCDSSASPAPNIIDTVDRGARDCSRSSGPRCRPASSLDLVLDRSPTNPPAFLHASSARGIVAVHPRHALVVPFLSSLRKRPATLIPAWRCPCPLRRHLRREW